MIALKFNGTQWETSRFARCRLLPPFGKKRLLASRKARTNVGVKCQHNMRPSVLSVQRLQSLIKIPALNYYGIFLAAAIADATHGLRAVAAPITLDKHYFREVFDVQ